VPPAQSYVGVERDDESSDQATAKVLPFPARTDCKPADECDLRDNWFEGSAGHARSWRDQAQIKIETPPNRTLFHFWMAKCLCFLGIATITTVIIDVANTTTATSIAQ
jgi:hypothetical protein